MMLDIDIDIRAQNHTAVEVYSMASCIQVIQSSCIAKEIVDQVKDVVKGFKRILVYFDLKFMISVATPDYLK